MTPLRQHDPVLTTQGRPRTRRRFGQASAMLALLGVACSSVEVDPTVDVSGAAVTADGPSDSRPDYGPRDVLLVGNSVSGTVSVIDNETLENLGSVNVLADLDERIAEIRRNPIRWAAYEIIRKKQLVKFEPHEGDRFVDDLFVSPDGKTLYVSRSNLGDVAAFDLSVRSHPMLWRTRVEGFKADHATISPDGTRLVVSATTVDKAHVLETATGKIIASFSTGNFPHQNDYSADGRFIYNASIGDVGLPPSLDFAKGRRVLTVVDASTFEVVRTYPFSAGIRPSVFTPDGKTMYAQLSFFNGVIEYDLTTGTTLRTLNFPLSPFAVENYPTRADYPHDSAYHGLAMSQDGRKLCAAGTIDNTVAIIDVTSFRADKVVDVGMIPYWSTTAAKRNDGRDFCFVTLSGDNAISVVDYHDPAAKELTRIPVGQFPQRTRLGRVPQAALDLLDR